MLAAYESYATKKIWTLGGTLITLADLIQLSKVRLRKWYGIINGISNQEWLRHKGEDNIRVKNTTLKFDFSSFRFLLRSN